MLLVQMKYVNIISLHGRPYSHECVNIASLYYGAFVCVSTLVHCNIMVYVSTLVHGTFTDVSTFIPRVTQSSRYALYHQ